MFPCEALPHICAYKDSQILVLVARSRADFFPSNDQEGVGHDEWVDTTQEIAATCFQGRYATDSAADRVCQYLSVRNIG